MREDGDEPLLHLPSACSGREVSKLGLAHEIVGRLPSALHVAQCKVEGNVDGLRWQDEEVEMEFINLKCHHPDWHATPSIGSCCSL